MTIRETVVRVLRKRPKTVTEMMIGRRTSLAMFDTFFTIVSTVLIRS